MKGLLALLLVELAGLDTLFISPRIMENDCLGNRRVGKTGKYMYMQSPFNMNTSSLIDALARRVVGGEIEGDIMRRKLLIVSLIPYFPEGWKDNSGQ